MPLVDAREAASQEVLRDQNDIAAIPRRFSQFVRETWLLQPRLEGRQGHDIEKLMQHPRFRAAYDFLVLRASIGEVEAETAEWWTAFQAATPEERGQLRSQLAPEHGKRRRRRRRRSSSS
jgi:poly(A) polymerase